MNPEPISSDESLDDKNDLAFHPMWWIGLALLILLAIFVAVKGIGFFLTVLSPPMPPLPVIAEEFSHDSEYHGRDTWVYTVPQDVQMLASFYESEGGVCHFEPTCTRTEAAQDNGCGLVKAICQGQYSAATVNIFWEAEAMPADPQGETSRLTLIRLIDWSGTGALNDLDK